MTRRRRRVAAAAVALCAWLPVAAAAAQGPVESLLEMRHQDVIVQHFDISCGAAALATILDYQFGQHFTEKQVAEGLIQRRIYIEHPEILRVREGFSLLDLKRFVDKLGFVGIGYGKLELADLLRLAPIIVAVRPVGYNHFVVFRGKIGDKVLLADPAFGNRTMSVENFERTWINFPQFGKVGFIVTRNGKPAPPGALGVRPGLFIAAPPDFVRQALIR
jgi:predicted double-glycine peptidase